jgi:hypothetical protein
MNIKKTGLHYAVLYNWEFGDAMAEPFSREEAAHEFAASLPGEAHIVEIIGYRANRQEKEVEDAI